jgi:hypothetical protein
LKKLTLIVATAVAGFARLAHAESVPASEILSMQNYQEGDVSISLPTERNSDGSICVGYISRISHDSAGKLTADIDKVCGQPAKVGGASPADLRGFQSYVTDDLTWQTPTTAE